MNSVVMIASCSVEAVEYEARQANARLIAAAPETAAERDRLKALCGELLGALKGLRCIIGENHCTCADCRTSKRVALAAIRKAEGGD